jgi:hypothetical protein
LKGSIIGIDVLRLARMKKDLIGDTMHSFDEFLSHAFRSNSAAIIDRPGTDVLVYMPVVMFPGRVAISEPILPRHRDDATPREREETTFETAQSAFALKTGYAVYEETGELGEALKANAWTSGSTVSTERGRREATHCHATARLFAWLHYRLAAGYSDVVTVDEVLPTMLRLLGISSQPEVFDFVRSARWKDGTLNLQSVEDFRSVLMEAIRPPRWEERRHRKWADVGNITTTYLKRLREHSSEAELVSADTALAGGASIDDVVGGLCLGKGSNGLKEAFWACSYLSLLDYERKPKAWEKRLANEVIARAVQMGLSRSIAAGRKLNFVLAETAQAKKSASAASAERLPLPAGFEDEWVSVGAGPLSLPETVPVSALTVRRLVAKEIGDRALDETVSHALAAFRVDAPDIELGFSQISGSHRVTFADANPPTTHRVATL